MCCVCKNRPEEKAGSGGEPLCGRCALGLPDPIHGKSVPCGRNQICPCGSKKKFKACCAKVAK